DIGCRMALSIYDILFKKREIRKENFTKPISDRTFFALGRGFNGSNRSDHAVLENSLFQENKWINSLKDKAWKQLGTSGGGNHFVEFGTITLEKNDDDLNLKKGSYIALLSHSGSRGLGATIANHYTKIAKSVCPLPPEADRKSVVQGK